MTKSELVKIYASRTNSSVVSSRKSVDILLDIISEELINKRPVLLTGFGRLFPQRRKLPQVRLNPRYGIPVESKTVKSRHIMTVRFKLCKALFKRLNQSKHSDESPEL